MVGTIVRSKVSHRKTFIANFVAGVGWGIGATIGVAIFIAIFTWILQLLGGLPLIGNFFANLIKVTNEALKLKQ